MSRERRSAPRPTPEYKAGRGDMPADFRGQLSLIQEVLEALRIPSLSVEGYEADDVIATLTTQAATRASRYSSAPAIGTCCNWSATRSPCSTRAKG